MAKENILLEGHNIYYDKHSRPIYYKKREKRGYRIPKHLEGQFKTLQSRFAIVLIIFTLLYILFKLNVFISVAVSLSGLILLEARFKTVLNKCTIIENYEPKGESKTYLQTSSRTGDLVLRAVLYNLCGILLIVNSIISPEVSKDATLKGISIAVAIATLYIGIKYIIVLIKKKKAS